MRPQTNALLVLPVFALVGALGWVFWPLPALAQPTPMQQQLDFVGPVRRIVELQTQEGGWVGAGVSSNRTVTEVSRDGRTATRIWTQSYTKRNGEKTFGQSRATYAVSGSPGGERLLYRVAYDTQSMEYDTRYVAGCAVRQIEKGSGTGNDLAPPWTATTTQTCNPAGRLLSEVRESDGKERTKQSYRWFGRLVYATSWNAGLEGKRPTTFSGLALLDNGGHMRYLISPLNLRVEHRRDAHGNWVWRSTAFSPTPMSGNTLDTREIVYWAGGK